MKTFDRFLDEESANSEHHVFLERPTKIVQSGVGHHTIPRKHFHSATFASKHEAENHANELNGKRSGKDLKGTVHFIVSKKARAPLDHAAKGISAESARKQFSENLK